MPLYECQCKDCHTTFEVRVFFQEKEHGLKPMYPKCQSTATHQLISLGLLIHNGYEKGEDIPSSCCGPSSGTGCCGS